MGELSLGWQGPSLPWALSRAANFQLQSGKVDELNQAERRPWIPSFFQCLVETMRERRGGLILHQALGCQENGRGRGPWSLDPWTGTRRFTNWWIHFSTGFFEKTRQSCCSCGIRLPPVSPGSLLSSRRTGSVTSEANHHQGNDHSGPSWESGMDTSGYLLEVLKQSRRRR